MVRETDKEAHDIQARLPVARNLERYVQQRQNDKRNKSGLSRKRSSTMQDNCEVFASLIQQMRGSLNLSKNVRRKLEVPMPEVTLKDDSGSYAVVTEQRSPASQMTAGNVSRTPVFNPVSACVSRYLFSLLHSAH